MEILLTPFVCGVDTDAAAVAAVDIVAFLLCCIGYMQQHKEWRAALAFGVNTRLFVCANNNRLSILYMAIKNHETNVRNWLHTAKGHTLFNFVCCAFLWATVAE